MNNFKIKQPSYIKKCHKILNKNGYESYIVGGCVRDYLLGKEPKDWDMTTNATPEQIISCFSPKYKIIETGLKHGTVTIIINNYNVEITTYRTESEYSDNRHPNEVTFVKNLKEDMFEASKVTSADKMVIAQYQTSAGWYGLNFADGCKLPTTINENLYTLAFTNERELKLYQNSIGYEQLVNDGIVNSMGVAGILIQDGAVTATEYINKIPQYNVKTSRVAIGQNQETGEIIILSTGKENDANKQGMTTASVASALLAAGCTIATELCEGDNSEMMNKGGFNYVPADNEVPSAVAYWYISRDEFYVNDCQYEIADLTQDYAKALWSNYLNALKIAQEIEDRKKVLAEYGGDFSSYLKSVSNPLPLKVIIMNNYDAINESDKN